MLLLYTQYLFNLSQAPRKKHKATIYKEQTTNWGVQQLQVVMSPMTCSNITKDGVQQFYHNWNPNGMNP